MTYNFLKLLLIGSILELIWPTQFFNRRHNINLQLFRFRTFVETFLKLKNSNYIMNVSYKSILIKSLF